MPQGHVTVGGEQPRQRLFTSIRTKLAVYFSLMAVAILIAIELTDVIGVPFIAYSGRRGQQRAEAFKSLQLVADLKKERLLRWLEERRDNVRIPAKNSLTAAAVVRFRAAVRELSVGGRYGNELWELVGEDQDYITLHKHLDDIQREYGIYNKLMIVDAKTGTIFVSTGKADLGTNFSHQNFLTGALRSGDVYVSDIMTDPFHRQPSLYFSHVIRDKAGEVVAVLVMDVSANDIIRPMLHTGEGLGERGEALLVNQDVRILTSLKHPLADGTIAKPLEYQIQGQPAVLAASGQEGIIEIEDYRGEPVLAAYRYIPVTSEWGWGMVVKRDREELFAPLRLSIAYSSAIGLIGILVLVALTAWLARSLTRPILALSQTAVKVAQGDLNARAPVITSDEVGHLAKTFNTMLQRIEERTEELTDLNKELEAFSYSVSHDLQAPLRAVDGFSRILLERHAGKLDAECNRLLNIIRSNTRNMGQMIDGLLAFSRLGRQEMNLRDINMGELATAAFEEVRAVAADRNLQCYIRELPPARGDPIMIRQVLVNLLSNAVKFTRPKDPAVIEVGHTASNSR